VVGPGQWPPGASSTTGHGHRKSSRAAARRHPLKIPIYVVGMSTRVSAEDQIERIIEQARMVERKSVNRMAFLQDVSALYLLGLRHLAKEIDQLHDPLEVVSDLVPPPNIEVPPIERTELAGQLDQLTSQLAEMTKPVRTLSRDLEKHSKDFENLSKRPREA
jgi:hypothetical protein